MIYYLEKYKFCPICTGELIKKNSFLKCTKCSYEIFNNPKPCAGVIIENAKNEILLVTRNTEPFKGWFDLPGGFSDVKENLEETAKREIMEELSIQIEIGKYVGSYTTDIKYKGLMYNEVVVYFEAKAKSLNISLCDELSGFEFVSRYEILQKRICAPEANKEALKDYFKLFP